MGTMLGSMGFDGCLPFLNLTEPETVGGPPPAGTATRVPTAPSPIRP